MLLNFIRAIFFIIILAFLFVGVSSVKISSEESASADFYIILWSGLILAVVAFLVDILTPKKSIGALAGLFFGLLVGIFISWAVSPVLDMINDTYNIGISLASIRVIKWVMGICICYIVISFVMRTKDDVRFVIPYVEFAKQTKGARPLILDTSVIIDGRVADLSQTNLFDAPLVVPRFVLNELQLIADSPDKLKRNRGRRGLDMLNKLKSDSLLDVKIDDTPVAEGEESMGVDQKLVAFTKACNGRLITNDYNLNKVAQLRQVDVVNVNDLANALKTIVLPGEPMEVKLVKPGEEAQQGVGYLDDGTMVVVEEGRDKIGKVVQLNVTSSLQTSAGRMIFGKYEKKIEPQTSSSGWSASPPNGQRRRKSDDPTESGNK